MDACACHTASSGQAAASTPELLFVWVASPHYLGEILSFVGYAMMSALLPVWGNALVVSAYCVVGRKHALCVY
jgi:3-oxo-5-alpha-steroid 4-dehydrogenase